VLAKIRAAVGSQPQATVACLGLAFKANVDDLRESPAVEIVAELARESHLRLLAVEPHAARLPRELQLPNVELVTLEAALTAASVIVLLVDHRAFLDLARERLAGKTIIDTRGVWR